MQWIADPLARTLATWRWPRNQSNHEGNSVKTSMSTVLRLPQERQVDVDDARLDVDRADRVVHERDEQRLGPGPRDLEQVARRVGEQALGDADLARSVAHGAPDQVLGPGLVLLQGRRGPARDEQRLPAQRLERVAAVDALQADDGRV